MSKVQVLDFWAPWCSPCKVLSPIIDSLKEDYDGNESVSIEKLNVDDSENSRSTKEYGIKGIPTLVFLKDGQEVYRVSGVQSKETINSKIQELI